MISIFINWECAAKSSDATTCINNTRIIQEGNFNIVEGEGNRIGVAEGKANCISTKSSSEDRSSQIGFELEIAV